MIINKAVIPAAGLGTRFLPFTKAIPKEMLPLIDKPAIQLIIQEALDAGIQQFLIITGKQKEGIQRHFSPNAEHLSKHKNHPAFNHLDEIIRSANFSYIHQDQPLGLGHAISRAKTAVGYEYFAVMLPDDIIFGPDPELSNLIKLSQKLQASIIAVQEVPYEATSSYGIIEPQEQIDQNTFRVKNLIRKTKPRTKPPQILLLLGAIFPLLSLPRLTQ